MKLKQSVCLAFMLFPALSFANNEFNSVIEDFDRYFETQEPQKPLKVDPKPSAVNSSSSSRTGQVRGANNSTIKPQQVKTDPQVRPSTNKTDNQVIASTKTPDVTLSENCPAPQIDYSKVNSDYTRYLTPLLSFVPINPQFSAADLNRYSYSNKPAVYNPLSLYTGARYPQQSRNENPLLDIFPGAFYSITAIPLHFTYQFNRSLLDHKQPLFNKELLNRLANTREKYQTLHKQFTEQVSTIAHYSEQLLHANAQIQQLQTELTQTEKKLVLANNLLKDDTLKESVANLQNELSNTEKERNTLAGQLAEKEKALQASTEKNNEFVKQQQEFESQQEVLKNLEIKAAQLEKEKELVQAQYAQAQALLKDNTAKKEIEKLQASLTTITNEQEKLTSQLNEKQALLAKIEKEKEDVQGQYAHAQVLLKQSGEQKDKEIAKLQALKDKEIDKLQTSLATVQSEQQKLTAQLTEAQTKFAQIEKEKEDVQAQYAQAQTLLKDNTAKKELERLQSLILKLTSEREDVTKQLADNQALLTQTQQDNKQQVDAQLQEVTQLKTQLTKSQQDQEQINKSLLMAQQQVADSDEKLKVIPELKLQLENKVKELADLKKGLSAGEKAIDTLVSDKNNLIAKLEKAQSDLSTKYQALDNQYKESNIAIAQLNVSKTENEKAYALLEKQFAERQDAINKLATQLEQAKVQSEQKNTENAQLIASLKQQQAESTAQVKLQESTLTNAQKELIDITKQLEAQRVLTKTLEEKELKLNEQIKVKEAELAQTNTDTTKIQKENKSLKEQLEKVMGEGQMISGQLAYAYSIIGKDNAQRNKSILSDIQKQNYTQYDDNTYFKILKQGKPVDSINNKTVVFVMHEELTDGTVTLNYDKSNPLILPYRQLPLPLNTFIAKAGINGKAKIYIKPGGGYGKNGVPGQIPPESMSIVTVEILEIK
ncbi:sugar transporter [Proteus hauseri]|uniref:sugar transporter n=1 Tax=Proteus hauseri TaxID=183417 RepID=UPI0032DACEEB